MQKMRYLARTKIAVNIEELGHVKKCIAVREKPSRREISPGVFLKIYSREFSADNFTNIYDLSWDPKQKHLNPDIHSSDTPYVLADRLNTDPQMIAIITGGWFFLADVADRAPIHLPLNLCIYNGEVIGLPSWDLPVAYVNNGKIYAQETRAVGTMSVGNRGLTWIGANSEADSKNKYDFILYNSKCVDVVKSRDVNNIQIGVLDSENITTPIIKNGADLVVKLDDNKRCVITAINKGGGTHFFDGQFILQTKNAATFKVGDHVVPLTLDTLKLGQMTSAITVGRSVLDPYFLEDVRVNRRDARTFLAQDIKGNMHFMVFDGSKYIPGFYGVSAKDIASYFSKNRFKWAYFLDGGGSSRIVVRDKNKLRYLANEFAFRKLPTGDRLWDWQKAREVCSSIELRVKSA